MDKTIKITILKQIEHFKNRGVLFNVMSEAEAEDFLRCKNYFFRMKSYLKNYRINEHGNEKKYLEGTEFSALCELSKIDTLFRRLILSISLDVEHFLKVSLMKDVENDSQEECNSIVNKAFNYDIESILTANDKKSFCKELIEARDYNFAIWEIIEVLSLGTFNILYKYYYNSKEEEGESLKNYSNYVESVRYIRNGAAHNNCLLSRISQKQEMSYTKSLASKLSACKEISKEEANEMLSNKVTHDFITLVYLMCKILPKGQLLEDKYEELRFFFLKSDEALQHLDSNKKIVDFFVFTKKSIDFFIGKNYN